MTYQEQLKQMTDKEIERKVNYVMIHNRGLSPNEKEIWKRGAKWLRDRKE